MSIEMDLLKRADPAAGPMPTDTRQELLHALRAADAFKPYRSKRRVAIVGTVAGAVLASTGGLAVALWTQAPATALKVNCAAGTTKAEYDRDGGFTSVIDTVSGDPVADCATQYAALGQAAPALKAYDVGASYLWVLPNEWQPPQGGRELLSEFRSDTTRLALKHKIDDPVDGPSSTCQTNAAVEQQVRGYLAELGLTGWTARPAPGAEQADGSNLCAFALLDESGRRTVFIQTGPPGPAPGGSPEEQAYGALKQKLRTDVSGRCLAIADAEGASEAALEATGVTGVVTSRASERTACATVDVTGYAPVQIILS